MIYKWSKIWEKLSPRTWPPTGGNEHVNNSRVRQSSRTKRKVGKGTLRCLLFSKKTKAGSPRVCKVLSHSGISGLWLGFAHLLLCLHSTESYSGYFPIYRVRFIEAQFGFHVLKIPSSEGHLWFLDVWKKWSQFMPLSSSRDKREGRKEVRKEEREGGWEKGRKENVKGKSHYI